MEGLLLLADRSSVRMVSLTRVRRGESGLGDIVACALSGIASALCNVSLVSESSSEPGTKADSFGREDGKTGTLSFLSGSGGGFSGEGTALTFEIFPDGPDADPSPPSQKSTLLPW